MNDKEILATIYRWVQQANSRDENPDHTRQRLKDIQSFVEQEWQKQDDLKDWRNEVFAKADDGQMYNMNDVNENSAGKGEHERFVKLKIKEDGTVEKIG